MEWSEKAWIANKSNFDKILQLPFIHGLMDGTLAVEKFHFYLQQDALYLSEYGKILAGIGAKLQKPEHLQSFLGFAGDTIMVERALHQTFLKNIQGESSKETPSCMLYISFMYRQLHSSPVEVALASILPCFWIYKEVGDYILANQTKGENPYQSWINTYGGETFANAVSKAISICDEYAADLSSEKEQKMTDAFLMASKMEWMFWNSAWNMEKWVI